MDAHQNDLNEVFRSTSMIGRSTSVCVIIYGLITYYLLSRPSEGQPVFDNVQVVRQIFLMVGVSIVLCIGLLRRLMMENARKKKPSGQELLKQLQTTSLVIFGICESIAILGLVLALLTRNMNDYYILGFLSLVSFGFFFPRIHDWEEQLKQTV